MGQVAIANITPGVAGALRSVTADVTFSSSYATGGDTVPLGQLGLQGVVSVHVRGGVLADSAQVPSRSYAPTVHGVQVVLAGTVAAPKLKAYSGSTSEVANATNLSTTPAVNIEFRGY
jgi:hypothetical protein